MMKLTSISWWTLLLGCGLLFVIWILTTRMRYGRLIINRKTPWNERQWSLILLAIAITMFILVNPIFHLITAGTFVALYYIFINKNILGRKINGTVRDSSRVGLEFGASAAYPVNFQCHGKAFSGPVEERKALDKCLFSFLTVADNPFPEMEFINGVYDIKGELSSKKYYSSLLQYLEKAGFEVITKNTK